MKKAIFFLLVAGLFMGGATFTSCQSPADKAEDAQSDVQDARENLTEEQLEAREEMQEANAEAEWETFKADAEAKIDANQVRIDELREAKRKSGSNTLDEAYKAKIDALQERNKELRRKISDRKPEDADWAAFKREFNHDMDELGKAFKDITVNNEN